MLSVSWMIPSSPSSSSGLPDVELPAICITWFVILFSAHFTGRIYSVSVDTTGPPLIVAIRNRVSNDFQVSFSCGQLFTLNLLLYDVFINYLLESEIILNMGTFDKYNVFSVSMCTITQLLIPCIIPGN